MATNVGKMTQEPVIGTMLSAAAATGAGGVFRAGQLFKENTANFRVTGASATTVGATVKLMGSTADSTTNGVELATFTLAGGTADVAGTPLDLTWPYFWLDVTSLDVGTTVSAEVSIAK